MRWDFLVPKSIALHLASHSLGKYIMKVALTQVMSEGKSGLVSTCSCMHKVPMVTCILLRCAKIWPISVYVLEDHSAWLYFLWGMFRQFWSQNFHHFDGNSLQGSLHMSWPDWVYRYIPVRSITIWRSWMPLVSPGQVAWVARHAAQGRCFTVNIWRKVIVTWYTCVPWEVHPWSQRAVGRYMYMSARSGF